MSARGSLRSAYYLLDRLFLARLPVAAQRTLIGGLLALAKRLHPSGRWPPAEALLVRRTLHAPPKPLRTLPDWALNDLQDLSLRVDPLLTPKAVLGARPEAFYTPVHWTDAGRAYERIRRRIGDRRFDTILLVPWLKRGGADLGALHHARACREAFGQRTLVISTQDSESPWAHRLGPDTPFLDISPDLAPLSAVRGEPEMVLARLLIQLEPARIHIINSQLAWRALERFGKAIGQKTKIFASLYCDEFTPEGRRDGLAQRYLPTCWRWLAGVITDNSASPEEWRSTLGTDPSLFQVVHFPAPEAPAVPSGGQRAGTGHRLLWASRIERQKRPALLVELAQSMPDFHWDVYGAPLHHGDKHLAQLKALANVSLHGSYDSFASIVRPDHLAYVYTSQWDGLPNVLLEAARAGLPVVAPAIGGIGDLIPAGVLLPASPSVEDYASAIGRLRRPEERDAWTGAQHDRLRDFTWNRFVQRLRQVPGYAT